MDIRLLFLVLFLTACQKIDKKEILAQLDDHVLYKEDVVNSIPKLDNKNDSIAFINQRAETWMRNAVILSEAQKNSQSKEIDILVDKYRNDLIIAKFERRLIEERMDTLVTESQIAAYIEKEGIDLEKGQALVKVKFAKVKSNQPDLEKFDALWEDKKWAEITDYCATFAEICLLEDEWMTLTEFKQYFPDKVFKKDVYKKRNYVQKSHGSKEYFLYVLDFNKESEEITRGEQNKVKKLILHSRAKSILKNYKEELYQSSLDNQKIKFYLN